MAEGRFTSVCSVQEFILRARKKYVCVRLLGRFLKTKVEDRKVEAISAIELNEYITQFIITVRTKDGTEYEQTSLRSLTARFERHLRKRAFLPAMTWFLRKPEKKKSGLPLTELKEILSLFTSFLPGRDRRK